MKKKYPGIDMYKTGQNIRRIMRLRGLTVREVQEYLELAAPQSVYHWFDGRCLPTVDNLYALSELLCVPVDALLCGDRREDFAFYYRPSVKRLRLYYERCLELARG